MVMGDDLFNDVADAFRKAKGAKRLQVLPGGAGSQAWHKRLQTHPKTGELARCVANVITILGEDSSWKDRIRWDTFGETIYVTSPPWGTDERPADRGEDTRPWTDEDDTRLSAWLHRAYKTDFHHGDVQRAVSVVAQASSYHPVRNYLRSVKWDGVNRLDSLFPYYFGAEDTAYHRAVGPKWMIAAVARVMSPGCKVDCVPILEGKQGIGKSTALAALAGEWFCDTPIVVGDREAYQTIRGRWVVELSELDSLSRAEVSATKAFLSAQQDHYRSPYARRAQTVPRQCVFAGTTNEDTYLKDGTGNRRFWPVACGAILRDALARDRDQLWAEARSRYEAGERWFLEGEEVLREAAEAADNRVQEDPFQGLIGEWLSLRLKQEPHFTTTTRAILTECLKLEVSRITRFDEMRIGAVMRRLVWVRKQVRIGDRREYRYLPASNANSGFTLDEIESRTVTQNQSKFHTDTLPSLPSLHDTGNIYTLDTHTTGGSIGNGEDTKTVVTPMTAPAALTPEPDHPEPTTAVRRVDDGELFADWLEANGVSSADSSTAPGKGVG